MDKKQENRHFTRIPFDAQVKISQAGQGQSWNSKLLDICLNGAMIARPEDWLLETGEAVQLELQLSEEDGLCLRMDTTVAHIENNRIGLHCQQMDLDTATHLHRLLELNLGDSELMKRELSELIQQH